MDMKPISIDKAVDEIESAIFDQSEPGCTDTEWGEMVLNSIGRIRLTAILKRLRVGYIKAQTIESLCPQDLRVRARLKREKKKLKRKNPLWEG
jgi:hypothetical protein